MDPLASNPEPKAGVIVQARPGQFFVSGEQALSFVEGARISPVPGEGFGLLWFEGQVVVAVPFEACLHSAGGAQPAQLGGARRQGALICEIAGQRCGLTGLELIASGRFPAGCEPDRVRYGEQEVLGVALELPAAFSALEPSVAELATGDQGGAGARS